jgi:hypothetical protein
MAFSERRHSPPPQWGRTEDRHHWQPAKQRVSLAPILLTAALVAAGVWVARSAIDQPRNPRLVAVDRHAKPATQTASGRCSDPDGTIHGWNGNGTGITPHDWLHFLPACSSREGRR